MRTQFQYVFYSSFSDTTYCPSILLPTENLLKKTLDSTFFKSKNGAFLNETDRIDLCCRSLYKCNAYKRIELNLTYVWNIRHCDCVHSFQICLKNLNTSVSNKVNFVHSLNTVTCFSKDHPIVMCIEFERYSDIMIQLFETFTPEEKDEERNFKRCIKYALDQKRKKVLQLFDVSFNENATYTTASMKFK